MLLERLEINAARKTIMLSIVEKLGKASRSSEAVLIILWYRSWWGGGG
jgi:hypothetical protein